MLDCKLYKKYYPLKTDGDVENFFAENIDNIRKTLNNHIRYHFREFHTTQDYYCKKYKREESFLGKPKPGNVLYNKAITNELDQHLKSHAKTIHDYERILHSVKMNEKVSVTDANRILTVMNNDYRNSIVYVLKFICMVMIICGIISLF